MRERLHELSSPGSSAGGRWVGERAQGEIDRLLGPRLGADRRAVGDQRRVVDDDAGLQRHPAELVGSPGPNSPAAWPSAISLGDHRRALSRDSRRSPAISRRSATSHDLMHARRGRSSDRASPMQRQHHRRDALGRRSAGPIDAVARRPPANPSRLAQTASVSACLEGKKR